MKLSQKLLNETQRLSLKTPKDLILHFYMVISMALISYNLLNYFIRSNLEKIFSEINFVL